MPDPNIARNTRRAAEMFHLWERGGSDDIVALVAEAEDAGEDLMYVVCSLLYVGSNLIKAAGNGDYATYLEQLRAASLLAEASSGGDHA